MLEVIGFVVFMCWVSVFVWFVTFDTLAEGLLSKGGSHAFAGILFWIVLLCGWALLLSRVSIN